MCDSVQLFESLFDSKQCVAQQSCSREGALCPHQNVTWYAVDYWSIAKEQQQFQYQQALRSNVLLAGVPDSAAHPDHMFVGAHGGMQHCEVEMCEI